MNAIFIAALWLQMSAQPQITTGTVTLAQLACNRNVETGEISPKECAEAAQRAADETDGLHECKDEADSNCLQAKCCDEKVKGADETDGKPPKCVWDREHNTGRDCVCESADKCRDYTQQEWAEFNRTINEPAERVDVPAVQVGYYDPPECHQTKCIHVKQTCVDKSRILEHDENSPPKYWCRKVQP